MHLSQFLKSILNFEYFFKKDDPHIFIISKIMALKYEVR